MPLDWDSDHFYEVRKEGIEERLEELAAFTREDMGEEVARLAEMYQGVRGLLL